MSSSIIVDCSLDQTRVAILEEKELVEMYFEDDCHESIVGNIYKGKIVNILPGMEAAFVDIGFEKNAFLYVGDVLPKSNFAEDTAEYESMSNISIFDLVKINQELLVQVIKEPLGTKGPRVTANITLPGRYIVLVPNVNYIGISRKIESDKERERLKVLIDGIMPEGFGIIARTAAQGICEEDISKDIDFLTKLWNRIKNTGDSLRAPCVVHKDEGLLFRIVRDIFSQEIDKFIINNKDLCNSVLEWVDLMSPEHKYKVELYDKPYNIFEFYQIQSKISRALSRKVWLKSGGYIIIDQTEALTVVDVNTGKFVGNNNLQETILKTNLEAAKEIAKQIRLRDIGGIIIIDFIDMDSQEHQLNVLSELDFYLKKDRTKTHVVGISQLGLVEMTRKKIRQNISSIMQMECPNCSGTGKVLLPQVVAKEIERSINKLFSERMVQGIILEAHPLVIREMEKVHGENLSELKLQYNKGIIVKARLTQNIDDFEVKDVDNIRFLC